jgi:dephospho-CoA kinase
MKKDKKKNVIGFVGLPGSGKSTALENITKLGPIITMGDVVRNEVKSQGLELNPQTLGKVAKELREMFGPDIIAKKCIELIKSRSESVVFVDGIRSMHEVTLFRQYWKFPVIAILCNESIRHAHLMERGRSDDSLNINIIKERDARELGFGVGDVIKNAEFQVENNSDANSLKQKTLDIIKNIISGAN